MCRAILEMVANHNVKTFVSLSSPQAGQFGGIILYELVKKTPSHRYNETTL